MTVACNVLDRTNGTIQPLTRAGSTIWSFRPTFALSFPLLVRSNCGTPPMDHCCNRSLPMAMCADWWLGSRSTTETTTNCLSSRKIQWPPNQMWQWSRSPMPVLCTFFEHLTNILDTIDISETLNWAFQPFDFHFSRLIQALLSTTLHNICLVTTLSPFNLALYLN